MVFFWRGAGIAILIFFFICAWLTSYSFEDTTLGNGSYMGWTMIWTSIPTLLLFLILNGAGGTKNEEAVPVGSAPRNQESLEEKNQTKTHWSHSFMFIPVAIWPLIFLGLGLYLIL